MNKLLERIKHNDIYLLIGLLAIARGLIFYQERSFFFYPPQFTWLMNNKYFYIALMIAGALLIAYVLSDFYVNKILGTLLGVIAGILVVIVCIEIEHITGAYQIKLEQNVASNIFIICIILWTARHCSKR